MYEPLAPSKPVAKAVAAKRAPRWPFLAGFVAVALAGAAAAVYLHRVSRPPPQEESLEDYLKLVDDFLDTRPRQSFMPNNGALLQTFGPGSAGGGPCGALCSLQHACPFARVHGFCRFDVYDNALAAIYYTKRQRFDKAKDILDGFLYYMYVKRQETNDKVTTGPEDGLPSGRFLNLLAASYTNARSTPGQYAGDGVADGAVDVGNNAWVGIALLRYAAATKDGCYATAGRDMLFALNRMAACDDDLQGFRARLAPYPMHYRSVEHNIDMFALASMCRNESLAAAASSFVNQMYGRDSRYPGAYVTGTANDYECSQTVGYNAIPSDVQAWNFLAGVDPALDRKATSLSLVAKPSDQGGLWERDTDLIGGPGGAGAGDSYEGTRFSSYGAGVQWENAASSTLALLKATASVPEQELAKAAGSAAVVKRMKEAASAGRDSLKRLLSVYGSVPASIRGGNYDMWALRTNPALHNADYPGGSDTGLGWPYLRYPHVASTVWAGLALAYQFEEGGPVDEMANPYAAAEGFTDDIYERADSCLGAKPGPNLAACSRFPQCVAMNVTGDCCPAPGGLNLGCCDTSASCARHPLCKAANLTGDCCPSPNGMTLGCCGT